ncbi:MAG: LuxR C-terminal-related transcriptional regulator [Candidatus Zixiibacteriota bacterium]
MARKKESDFAEIIVDQLFIESFPVESSAYYKTKSEKIRDQKFDQFRNKFRWHVSRSLSMRQKQVLLLTIEGKKQREIAVILGITQQVVSIYKRRALNKLKNKLTVEVYV